MLTASVPQGKPVPEQAGDLRPHQVAQAGADGAAEGDLQEDGHGG